MALQLYVQPRGGELIGQGIMQAAQGVAAGIDKYYQRKEENEKMEQAADFFARAAESNPELARSLNIRDPKDKAALKAGIKAAGGPMQFMQTANAMQQMMERQQAAELERKQRFALQAAFGSGQPTDSSAFLRNAIAMGADPRMAAPVANVMQDTEIADLRAEAAAAKANKPAHTPEVKVITGPDGRPVRVVSTSANQYQVLPETEADVAADARPVPGLPMGKDGKPRYYNIRRPDGNWQFIDLERGEGGINFSFSPAGVTASQ